jgi:ankyrin repeat protein
VEARNTSEQTSLHVAAEHNLPSMCSILLSNHIDFAAVDNQGNTALHVAVKEGHLNVVKTLLTESAIDAEAFNNKGTILEKIYIRAQ